MGYAHIENLYRVPDMLQCYALEKVHGTSAHVKVRRAAATRPAEVSFSAGGVPHPQFSGLFDAAAIRAVFEAKFPGPACLTIYGEAFGGKCQGMSGTYGKELRFLAFDVRLEDETSGGGVWLDVASAAGLAAEFGIGFVPYEQGPLTLEWLDGQRDRDSLVAIAPGKMREGIVIRPIREAAYKNGERVIAKHKRDEFKETATPRAVDPAQVKVLADANAVAAEWVTAMRLAHVLDKVPFTGPEDTGRVVRAMQEDVRREGAGEIAWSKDVEKAIGRATARLLHSRPGAGKGEA